MALNCFYPGFFFYQDLQASPYPALSSTTPFHKSCFFTLQPLSTHMHTQVHHTYTSAHAGTNVHTHRLWDMALTRWMTSLSPAATHTQTQQLRSSYTCTFWLRNGKCQSLSMAGPGNAVIPSLPPIALITGKCHLISQVHVAWLISEKRKERETDGEIERHGICPVCFFGHICLCGIKWMSMWVRVFPWFSQDGCIQGVEVQPHNWQEENKGRPDILPSCHPPELPGESRGLPPPDEFYNPSIIFWVCLWSQLSVGSTWKT